MTWCRECGETVTSDEFGDEFCKCTAITRPPQCSKCEALTAEVEALKYARGRMLESFAVTEKRLEKRIEVLTYERRKTQEELDNACAHIAAHCVTPHERDAAVQADRARAAEEIAGMVERESRLLLHSKWATNRLQDLAAEIRRKG
jgi:hypothetical protein